MLHMFFFTFSPAVGAYGSLQLSIQPWICAPGTHYGWVDQGSVEYEVFPTLLHVARTGNRTTDLLILSPTPYPLGHMLPQIVAELIVNQTTKVPWIIDSFFLKKIHNNISLDYMVWCASAA